MISRAGRPTPNPEGGGKRGTWHFEHNGSGTWTRVDPNAMRYRPLLRAGPTREEVTCRRTYDARTGDELGEPMKDYARAKFLAEPLPDPVPRPIRTVFHFDQTSVVVPPECRNIVPAPAVEE